MYENVLRLDREFEGRTFMVGDLHGRFSLLMDELNRISFDFDADRLICTGDLVDRGHENVDCVELLERHWFYSVVGNHDYMILRHLQQQVAIPYAKHNGAYWVYSIEPDDAETVERLLNDNTHFAIEIWDKEVLKVGVFHSSVPNNDWNDLDDYYELADLLFERTAYDEPIRNCEMVVHGHTVTSTLTPGSTDNQSGMYQRHNAYYIDVGACHYNKQIIHELLWENDSPKLEECK